jgi:flavin reductase (DIM6/NTAB) family NADH-FMN oxidoreductase RutF
MLAPQGGHGEGRFREAVSSSDFKEALSRASAHVTVVATNGPFGLAGLTCSAVCSVCDNPPTILLCVSQKSFATSIIKKNGVLSVNWLAAGQAAISRMFAGFGAVPMQERFARTVWETITTGAPCRTDAVICFDCTLVNTMDIGSHSVIFAHVVAKRMTDEHSPLVYHRRQYVTTRPLTDSGQSQST